MTYIPTLKGKDAEEFARKADKVLADKKAGKGIDFSKQAEIARQILAKAKL